MLAAQDEPMIIMHMTYVEALDELLGFCGVTGDNCQYLDHFTVKVGDEEKGYNATISALQECKIGSYARAMILNALHPNLPRVAILCMPTCDKFDTMVVYSQWQEVQLLYERGLEEKTEDYAPACWKQGCRKQILTNSCRPRVCGPCRNEETEDGHYIIQDLCDQDYIHDHNKMLNPLDHATRVPNQRPNPMFLGTQVYLLIVLVLHRNIL